MASIKSTITLQTTTLFPTPVNLTVPVTEQVNVDASFATVVIPAGATTTVYGPTAGSIGGNTVYFYAKAAAANADPVNVIITDDAGNTATVMTLRAGDFAWFPLAAFGAGVEVELEETGGSDPATVEFFYGERGA